MVGTKDYAPLFPEYGGPAQGFRCNATALGETVMACGKVTRTERGMLMHLSRVHGIEQQAAFFPSDRSRDDETRRTA